MPKQKDKPEESIEQYKREIEIALEPAPEYIAIKRALRELLRLVSA
jgi:hypothetical protein